MARRRALEPPPGIRDGPASGTPIRDSFASGTIRDQSLISPLPSGSTLQRRASRIRPLIPPNLPSIIDAYPWNSWGVTPSRPGDQRLSLVYPGTPAAATPRPKKVGEKQARVREEGERGDPVRGLAQGYPSQTDLQQPEKPEAGFFGAESVATCHAVCKPDAGFIGADSVATCHAVCKALSARSLGGGEWVEGGRRAAPSIQVRATSPKLDSGEPETLYHEQDPTGGESARVYLWPETRDLQHIFPWRGHCT